MSAAKSVKLSRSRLIVAGLMLVALVQPCWPLALTTFGKSNPQNNQQSQNNDRKDGESERQLSAPYEQHSKKDVARFPRWVRGGTQFLFIKKKKKRVQARECASDSECAGIKGASCLDSIFAKDNKRRCLCGDYREPRNGLCDNQYKSAKVLCNNNDECTPGAQCMLGNDTSLPGRRCWCLSGYEIDEDRQCSGTPVSFSISVLWLLVGLLITGNA
ncbi:uncharacterized protein LOC106648058 isoform X1 [Trichogramma pretiosum]|uniref:uncharacterized protein LOC106648058 isoform X1 n=1 Tax=Trichogramma pretiosum TaxID=7493 RepID=UPI0006C9AAA2|nr:uncharacterized protein LOC106648058 isoform X1 [Trichogramma pretiosum]